MTWHVRIGRLHHYEQLRNAAAATLEIPFGAFSDDWDDATGDLIRTCADDAVLCPDDATLRNLRHFAVWAEGVGGAVHLEIERIWATGCTEEAAGGR